MKFEIKRIEIKIKFFVEKLLSKFDSPANKLSENYLNWKKEYKPKDVTPVVSDIIGKYEKSLMAKICTEEMLQELQKANPAMEIQMQDLEDLVCEKFDL